MATGVQNMTALGLYVKSRRPIHDRQRNSVLSEIGNKLHGQNTENAIQRQPLKPTVPANVARNTTNVKKEIAELTDTFKSVSITNDKPARVPVSEKSIETEQISYSSALYNIQDIDKEVINDITFVAEYAKDIFEYLRGLEVKYPLRQGFLCGTVTPRMRSILLDWLVDVQLQFSLLPETLFLTVGIIDRFLQKNHIVEKKKIQLLGAASMFLASKFEETYPPEISNFVYVCSNLYTKGDILKMECKILKTLDCFLGYPLSVHFLRRYSKASAPDDITYTLAKYFQELCLLDYDLCYYTPSRLAAASLYLALRLRAENSESDVWSDTLVYYSQYKYKDIAEVVKKLIVAVTSVETSKFQAVYKKYSSRLYFSVSQRQEVSKTSLKKLSDLL